MTMTFPSEAKQAAIASLKRYFAEHWDLDIGDLKADLLLDYVTRELGPLYYNAAISDAQTYLRDRVADLEGVCFEKEFTFWPASARDRR